MEADVFGPLMGVSSVDRSGLARDANQVLSFFTSPEMRFLVIGKHCVDLDTTDKSPKLRWRQAGDYVKSDFERELVASVDNGGDAVSPSMALQDFIFLGRWAGRYRFAYQTTLDAETVEAADVPVAGEQPTLVRLRNVVGDLTRGEAELAAIGSALTHWHATHRYCGACGTPTDSTKGGWERVCPSCSTSHYPRTDCAVIMSVVDSDDRLLLARNVGWPADRMSTLAGFLEPAETLENAVRREVLEETGIEVCNVEYVGSQGWPFPGQVMTAFTAQAMSTEISVAVDEIDVAQWFTREQYRQAVAKGQLRAANRTAVSGMLISRWLDGKSLPKG